MQDKILGFDIGGTSCRMALFRITSGMELELLDKRTIPSSLVHNDEELWCACENEIGDGVLRGLMAVGLVVAGPVSEGKASLVNADMSLSVEGLRRAFSCKSVTLDNDFAGVSMAVASEAGRNARLLYGERRKELKSCSCGVIGPGTGLGCGMLLFDACGHPTVVPSEGGHMPYGFATQEERELQAFLQRRLSKELISMEDVVSGRGLEAVHAFKTGAELCAGEIGGLLCLGQATPTRDLFAYALGKACGTWALASLCFGGLWIAGGVAINNPSLARCPSFRRGFVQGRHSEILEKIPVFLFRDTDCGLWGAATIAKSDARRPLCV